MHAVLDLVPQRRAAQRVLHHLVEHAPAAHALQAQTVGDVFVDALRERIRFLEHHAHTPAQIGDVHRLRRRYPGHPSRMPPSMRTPSTRSFMRLKQRSNVDLPQPLGPMKAVTRLRGIRMLICLSACFLTVIEIQVLDLMQISSASRFRSISVLAKTLESMAWVGILRSFMAWFSCTLAAPGICRRRL